MRIAIQSSQRAIALIIVMVSILVLSILVGAFAYAMKVETKLARNSSFETELEWLGRSGVELARWVLAQQLTIASEPYDALNQIWAGGPGGIGTWDSPLAEVQLENVEFGNGRFSVKITDLERKLNVNLVPGSEPIFEQALTILGFEQAPTMISCIVDWIDRDDLVSINGAESDYYESLSPPYIAKNGPIDDITELLLIKDLTPEMYWGSGMSGVRPAAFQVRNDPFWGKELPAYPVGLVEIFTPVSSGRININTASATVLGFLLDDNCAHEIIQMRAGPDGVEGTDDDTPIEPRMLMDILRTCTGSNQGAQQMARIFDVRSRTFEVQVEAEISGYKREFVALIGRNNQRDVQVLSFYWK